ncbi:glycine-rich protein 23-like [Papaver somniferum]|uniref:glycine-rich protein 23-like n=1 Tax=Papaver somniferum TaxID=3469 RepID=UPI000E704EF2|nr:glycine-rich protein 23-like [Papaver somniferum]
MILVTVSNGGDGVTGIEGGGGRGRSGGGVASLLECNGSDGIAGTEEGLYWGAGGGDVSGGGGDGGVLVMLVRDGCGVSGGGGSGCGGDRSVLVVPVIVTMMVMVVEGDEMRCCHQR